MRRPTPPPPIAGLFSPLNGRVWREAVDWVWFSAAVGILLNAFLPNGIDLKVKPKPATAAGAPAATAAPASYEGWNSPSHPKAAPKARVGAPAPRGGSAYPITLKYPTAGLGPRNDVRVTQSTSAGHVAGGFDGRIGYVSISLTGARKFFEEKSVSFLDARKAADYANGHIPGAVNFYAEEFDSLASKVLPRLDPEKTYVIYCTGSECDLSHELARRLSEQGFRHLKVFFGGWPEWKKASLPVQTGAAP